LSARLRGITLAAMTAPNIPQIRLYQNWLRDTRGLSFESYDALWRWSTTELDACRTFKDIDLLEIKGVAIVAADVAHAV